MKKTRIFSALFALILCATLVLSFVSCGGEMLETPAPTEEEITSEQGIVPAKGIWKDAAYHSPQVFGQGEKEFYVKVKAEGYSVTFTVKTDEENLGKALLEAKIVEGEEGPYGLYIKKVNGMLADYDVNKTYWSFCIDGKAQMSGVSDVTLSGGEEFELVLSK